MPALLLERLETRLSLLGAHLGAYCPVSEFESIPQVLMLVMPVILHWGDG